MELTCPKCHGTMRNYERNGVHVDQCSECRGIFLDRGELERLMEAENSWHAGAPAAQEARQGSQPQQSAPGQASSLGGLVGEVMQQVRAQQSGHGQQGHAQQGYGQQAPQRYQPRKKKSSFLGELFG